MHYAYRSWRREWGTPGARRCGGALVWQMNDCWPGISWAVVDYFRVRKPAFYAMQRVLKPLAISVVRAYDPWTKGHYAISKSLKYDVWIASDGGSAALLAQKPQVEVELRFVSIQTGQDAFPTQRHTVADVQVNATNVVLENVEIANSHGEGAFIIIGKLLVNGAVVSRDVDWPQPFKFISFEEDRGLKVQLSESRNRIGISSQRPVKGLIFAERPGLKFSDNGFDVVPGEDYSIEVEGLEAQEQLEWRFLGIDEHHS